MKCSEELNKVLLVLDEKEGLNWIEKETDK